MTPPDLPGDRIRWRSTAANLAATIRPSVRSPSWASAQKALTKSMATTLSSSLTHSPSGAVSSRSTWRHANGGTLHFPKGRQAIKSRLFCAPPPDPESKWWTTPLSPEDLVEPTGEGREELEAIWDVLVQDPLRPILLALQEIKATGGNIFRCRCFHAGLVSGPLLLVAGFCQVYRVAPYLCVDIVLGYIYYRLSVLAAELKRNGKASNICIMLQYGLLLVLRRKGNDSNKDSYYYVTLFIWSLAFHVYLCAVLFECIGVKHPRHHLEAIFKTLVTTKGGVIKALKFIFFGIE